MPNNEEIAIPTYCDGCGVEIEHWDDLGVDGADQTLCKHCCLDDDASQR